MALRPDSGAWPPLMRLRDHTHWTYHTRYDSSGRGSVRRRDLYLTTHNTHNRQISIPPAVFVPTIPAS